MCAKKNQERIVLFKQTLDSITELLNTSTDSKEIIDAHS